ncbi:hypothetical protein [Pseudarthrobacter sp. C4D7]|uniref:hypothetical protein n=1 Tax=Pseudarthrobacter sp. C4D7 TaxID=2735268 RepID=UPI00158519DA|nr:hypothetical protein [Pseudarthrobacter sp. C4D7]NUT72235.1 hypothetical protein [Pseudarthrobacter sp. C4D7]
MDTLKKVVTNQYFPAGAVLTAVLLFWVVAMLGGLSLLNNNQPPLTTLTWMLFVYAAAVLTPLAGLLAAVDLVRRWRRNRAAASATANPDGVPAGAGDVSQQGQPRNGQSQSSQPAPAKPQRPGRQEAA